MKNLNNAVLVIFSTTKFTIGQYDQLRPIVKWEADHPSGALFHAAGCDVNGQFMVADVWESREQLEQFVHGRLLPGMTAIGADMPTPTIVPLHNLNAFPALKEFIVATPVATAV